MSAGIHHVAHGQAVLVALEPVDTEDEASPPEGMGVLAAFHFQPPADGSGRSALGRLDAAAPRSKNGPDNRPMSMGAWAEGEEPPSSPSASSRSRARSTRAAHPLLLRG